MNEAPKEDGPQIKVRGQAINSFVKQDVDGQVAGAWESMVTTDPCSEVANQARGKSSALVAMAPELQREYTDNTFRDTVRPWTWEVGIDQLI